MNDHKLIVLRLTGRPELERGTWFVHDDWESVSVVLANGPKRAVPTGHYEQVGTYVPAAEVWVPEARLNDMQNPDRSTEGPE